jgi:oligopeptide/dipeptide ABC transporter ATP-binding protein
MTHSPERLLELRDLRVTFATDAGPIRAVDGLALTVHRGEIVAVVGESGSGKSVAMLALLGLLDGTAAEISGEAIFDGVDLLGLSRAGMRRVRGARIAIAFQDAMSALNPVRSIGWQIAETVRFHQGLNRRDARAKTVELLRQVRVPDPQSRIDAYPHQLSGGMRQRVMIAIALANRPDLIIADEPTTALDVTVQAEILELLREINRETGTAIVLITHDMGVVSEIAEQVIVMYAGRVMETGSVGQVMDDARHPYARALLRAVPRLDLPKLRRLNAIPGQPASALARPSGCPFHPRCALSVDACWDGDPPLVEIAPGHAHACIRFPEHVPLTALALGADV